MSRQSIILGLEERIATLEAELAAERQGREADARRFIACDRVRQGLSRSLGERAKQLHDAEAEVERLTKVCIEKQETIDGILSLFPEDEQDCVVESLGGGGRESGRSASLSAGERTPAPAAANPAACKEA